jgi:hypothetical protein
MKCLVASENQSVELTSRYDVEDAGLLLSPHQIQPVAQDRPELDLKYSYRLQNKIQTQCYIETNTENKKNGK